MISVVLSVPAKGELLDEIKLELKNLMIRSLYKIYYVISVAFDRNKKWY
jgi:hypothetical protein